MKKRNKFIIYGILLMIIFVASAYPLSLINNISTEAFGYATISWASIFFIGIFITIWIREMNKINKLKGRVDR